MIRRFYYNLTRLFMDIQLRHKLLISFLILIFVPLGVLTYLTYERFSKNTEEYVLNSSNQNFNLAYAFISDKMNIVNNVSNLINFNKAVNDLLVKTEPDYPVMEQLQDLYDFQSYLTSIEYNNDLFRIRLYLKSGMVISNENVNLFNLNKVSGEIWYEELMSSDLSILWCPSSYLPYETENTIPIISAVRKMKNPNDYSEISGLLRIDLDESLFHDIISNSNFIKKSITCIVNSKNVVVTSSDEVQIRNYTPILPDLIYSETPLEILTPRETASGRIFYRTAHFKNTDWSMVTIIPYSEIFTSSREIRDEMILLLVIITTLSYLLASYFSFSITKRITRLTQRMKRVQNGNLESITMAPSKDEIGQLIDNYNYMIKKISELIEEQYQAGFEIKNSELKALQAQINPHFLYNTLDMINTLSQQERNRDIETAIRALAKFYRLSLSEGKMIIPVRDEIQHVSFYVQIQNIRYPDKINLILDIPDEIMECSIPKISLQPIVENSIMHGILRKPDKEGTIKITGSQKGKTILLTISDDGPGIPAEILPNLLKNQVDRNRGSGFGIKNINDRIKLLYGEPFGLTFQSHSGKGTIVSMTLPYIVNPPSHKE